MPSEIQARKQAAEDFLRLVSSGAVDQAYHTYVEMGGRHHNPYFPAGFPALKKAMIEAHASAPIKTLTVRNVVGEGDLVAVHSRIVMSPGDTEYSTVHLFRFQGEKIVELWDCVQAVPADSPNRDGAFGDAPREVKS
jgi:predicted SnoaL-like aldol condensation-catalyzing enzyme